MGAQLKTRDKKRKTKMKKVEIAKLILRMAALAGLLSLAVIAPNSLQMLKLFQTRKRRYFSDIDHSVKRAVNGLKRRGLIRFVSKNNKTYLEITDKGREEFLKYQLGELKLKKDKWDGKWRLIIFDIDEDYKKIRDALRRRLSALGFLRLQDSVWVYPHDCEELAILLKAYFKTGYSVLYMVSERIENDKWLKQEFGL